MDFKGQAKAERLSKIIITIFGIIGLVWGYIIEEFYHTLYILGVGVFISCILTLPPWPIFRRDEIKWQRPKGIDNAGDHVRNVRKKKK